MIPQRNQIELLVALNSILDGLMQGVTFLVIRLATGAPAHYRKRGCTTAVCWKAVKPLREIFYISSEITVKNI